MATVLVVLLGPGLVLALGFLLHLAWFWVTGQDARTPQERAWEEEAQPRRHLHEGPAHP